MKTFKELSEEIEITEKLFFKKRKITVDKDKKKNLSDRRKTARASKIYRRKNKAKIKLNRKKYDRKIKARPNSVRHHR